MLIITHKRDDATAIDMGVVRGRNVETIIWRYGKQHPDIDESVIDRIVAIEADDKELELVLGELSGIPTRKDRRLKHTWHGDIAAFIAENFSFSFPPAEE